MSAVVEVERNPNEMDLEALAYLKYMAVADVDLRLEQYFTLVKTVNGVPASNYDHPYGVDRSSDNFVTFYKSLRGANPDGAIMIFVPKEEGKSNSGYCFFHPIPDGTNTVDVIDLDDPTRMVDICGVGTLHLSVQQLIAHAHALLEAE